MKILIFLNFFLCKTKISRRSCVVKTDKDKKLCAKYLSCSLDKKELQSVRLGLGLYLR